MKYLKRIIVGLVVVITLATASVYLSGNKHLFKAVASTYLLGRTGPSINDYKLFDNRIIPARNAQEWKKSTNYTNTSNNPLLKQIKDYKTTAYVVVKNNEILFEKYFNGYTDTSLTNSFSVAKTFVSILIGIAIDEGKITSIDDPIDKYLPKYNNDKKVTIRQLLTMSSGINFDESYSSPFGYMAKAYYGRNLKELTYKYKVEEEPGKTWRYLGGNTILLSFILENATGQSLSAYMSEKLWQPLGAQQRALWTLDKKKGVEKAYCCFYSNAKDFARIGQLYLNKGLWNGKRIVSEQYVESSVKPAYYLKDKNNVPVDFYGYHWWLSYYKNMDVFYARGILGQFIIVIPEKNIVIVRLGEERGEVLPSYHTADFFIYIDFALEL